MRVLVVADEIRLNRIICETLGEEGFDTDSCTDGAAALALSSGRVYDVAVLDVLMPKMNGLETARQLRARGVDCPFLFLTSLDAVSIPGGGDDRCLAKPFFHSELASLVREMTELYSARRGTVYSSADLRLDTCSGTVTRGGRSIELTSKEFALLELLLSRKGHILTRETIESEIWAGELEPGSNVVNVYIGYLRKKIDSGQDTKLIKTVWGSGWVLKDE